MVRILLNVVSMHNFKNVLIILFKASVYEVHVPGNMQIITLIINNGHHLVERKCYLYCSNVVEKEGFAVCLIIIHEDYGLYEKSMTCVTTRWNNTRARTHRAWAVLMNQFKWNMYTTLTFKITHFRTYLYLLTLL